MQDVKTLLIKKDLVHSPRLKLSLGDDLIVVLEIIVVQYLLEVAKLVCVVDLKQYLEKI